MSVAISEEVTLNVKDFGLECGDEEFLHLGRFSSVITGGSALALWIRFLDNNSRSELRDEIAPEQLALAKNVADWDIHPNYFTDPPWREVELLYTTCSLKPNADEKIQMSDDGDFVQKVTVAHPDKQEHGKETEYDLTQKVLRDLLARIFPAECKTIPDTGCGYVDYNMMYLHKSFEGKYLSPKIGDEFVFQIPPKVSLQETFDESDPVWSLGILHPAVALGTHLDNLSLQSFEFTADNHAFTTVRREQIQKYRRKAARIAVFVKLLDDGNVIKVHGKNIKISRDLLDAANVFLGSPFCQKLLHGTDEDILVISDKINETLTYFGGKTSFVYKKERFE